jgi:hypothetical protein
MSKQNNVYMWARVAKKPLIARNRETGEYLYGMGYVHVVRGVRDAHDNIRYIKHDYPLILSKDADILDRMCEWEANDIVVIKGILVSKNIDKPSYCPNCIGEDGEPTKNIKKGTVLYVNPIYVRKVAHYDEKKDAVNDILESREISNQALFIGTCVREPKIYKTKKGTTVCQYQLAINRKYHIRTDDPTLRTDWPWVKSYGEQAIEDKLRIKLGTVVYIDGFIQARNVVRRTKCKNCGKIYTWNDHSMEIVPYAVEYGEGTFRSDADIAKEESSDAETLRQQIHDGLFSESITKEDEREISDDIDRGSYEKKPVADTDVS